MMIQSTHKGTSHYANHYGRTSEMNLNTTFSTKWFTKQCQVYRHSSTHEALCTDMPILIRYGGNLRWSGIVEYIKSKEENPTECIIGNAYIHLLNKH